MALLKNDRNQEKNVCGRKHRTKGIENDHRFQDGLNLQFLLLSESGNEINKKSDPDYIRKLAMDALKISNPDFSETQISSYFLTNVEIKCIENIAIAYGRSDDVNRAIDILYSLKSCMDRTYVNEGERAKVYPLVMYNLSKYLGLQKRFDEAIDICDAARRICIDSSDLALLPTILFNKAYCLFEKGDTQLCKRLVYQAYCGCDMIEEFHHKAPIKKYAKDVLGIDIDAE